MQHSAEKGTSAEDDDDDDAMRLAFQQFMMTGRHGDANNHPNTTATTTTNNNTMRNQVENELSQLQSQSQLQLQQQGQRMKKAERRYWQIFQKFAIMVRDEWFHLDDEAYRIVEAVSHIRSRLSMEARVWKKFHHRHHHDNNNNNNNNNNNLSMKDCQWACHANHPLTLDIQIRDVDLALCHDLEQHEQMMVGLRSLFANLSECHESLMRQMDAMMKHHLECCKEFHNGMIMTVASSLGKAASLTQVMACVLDMLSQELYRKQCLVHMILDSVNDTLIGQDDEHGDWSGNDGAKDMDVHDHRSETHWEQDSMTPQRMMTAESCSKRWSREDALYGCVDVKVMTKFFGIVDMKKE
jgi:hypothetical protein